MCGFGTKVPLAAFAPDFISKVWGKTTGRRQPGPCAMSKNTATLLTDGDDSVRLSPPRTVEAGSSATGAGDGLSPLSLHADTSFQLLFSNHPHPMFVFDRETLEYLDVNDAAVRNYGFSRE